MKTLSLNQKNKSRSGWIVATLTALVVAVAVIFSHIWFNRGIVFPIVPQQKDNGLVQESENTLSPEPLTEDQEPLKPLPESKIIPGRKHIYQSFNNCGPASLSMLLSYYDIDVSQAVLGNELRPVQHAEGDNDDKSVTLDELAERAREYGLIVYHRPAGDIEIVKHCISYDIPVLARTWLKPDEDIGHYRVVRGYNERRNVLIQDDSLQGKNRRYTYQEFLELWEPFNYEFLVLVPDEKQGIAEKILGELKDEKAAWEKALELTEQGLKGDPENYYARFNKSVALYNLGRYEESIKAFEMSEEHLPRRMLWYQVEPIKAYYKVGDYERALSMTSELVENGNRAFSELYYIRGLIYEERGEEEKAEESFSNAKRYNPTEYWRLNVEDL